MNRDGSDPKQVSKEDVPPAQPAGLVAGQRSTSSARKHFTPEALARRRRDVDLSPSWAATGLQTHKKCDRSEGQRRAGVLARRQLHLLQRRCLRRELIFEYNKDPNTQIYAIQRV